MFVGAMDREISGLIKYYSCKQTQTLLNNYPLFESTDKKIKLIQTHVGDTNAALAVVSAIHETNPDFVLKIGCVGGNSAGVHSGDLIVPAGFFHSGSWITRSRKDNKPTGKASMWQSVFGDKPYQVNSQNLGEKPYIFYPDTQLNKKYQNYLNQNKIDFVTAYIGGGNMWFFDLPFMKQVLSTQVPGKLITTRWVADMESYSMANACNLLGKPFSGIYRVSNSDYYDEPYIPEKVADLFVEDFVKKLSGFIDLLL